jgi:hypothetical protein
VVHTQLRDPRPRGLRLGDQLGADRGAVGGEVEALHDLAPHQLERAVDVAHRDVEEHVDERVPRGGVGPPVQAVGARDAVADDEVVVDRERQELLELAHVELQVRVGHEHPRQPGGGDAGAQRRAVAVVALVHEDAHARVLGGAQLGHAAGAVAAAVVDDDDLVRLGDALGGARGLVDGAPDVRRLVVARQDDRETGELRGGGHGPDGPVACSGRRKARVGIALAPHRGLMARS